jgi:outer membrane immunogenic protein
MNRAVAARFGGTFDRTMVFVKGGAAWTRDDYSFSSSFEGPSPTPGPSASLSDTRWGWMVGAGVEHAFTNNWSAKVEYNYMDFGTESYVFAPGALPAVQDNIDISQRIHLIKFGINYRFDWGKYPVAARY